MGREGNRAAKDEELAQRILEARERMLKREGRPERITANGLVLEAGINRALQTASNRAAWPRLVAAIERSLDKDDGVIRRRLEWRARQAVRDGRKLKGWDLLMLCQRYQELNDYARGLRTAANIAIGSRDPERSFEAALDELRRGRN